MERIIFEITDRELEDDPRLARKLLLGLWLQRVSQMSGTVLQDDEVAAMKKLLLEWLFCRPALPYKVASKKLRELLQQPEADELELLLIVAWAGKKGPGATKRHAAIEALFLREYLQKPWIEITRRVCPCGNRHTNGRILTLCRPVLQAEVRILKGLLRS